MRVAKLVGIGAVAVTLAACGSFRPASSSGQADSSGHGDFSVSQVKNAFATQGVALQTQLPSPDPLGTVWLHDRCYSTVLVGVFKRLQKNQGHIPGVGHYMQHGNVVVICHGPCSRRVILSFQQLR